MCDHPLPHKKKAFHSDTVSSLLHLGMLSEGGGGSSQGLACRWGSTQDKLLRDNSIARRGRATRRAFLAHFFFCGGGAPGLKYFYEILHQKLPLGKKRKQTKNAFPPIKTRFSSFENAKRLGALILISMSTESCGSELVCTSTMLSEEHHIYKLIGRTQWTQRFDSIPHMAHSSEKSILATSELVG